MSKLIFRSSYSWHGKAKASFVSTLVSVIGSPPYTRRHRGADICQRTTANIVFISQISIFYLHYFSLSCEYTELCHSLKGISAAHFI